MTEIIPSFGGEASYDAPSLGTLNIADKPAEELNILILGPTGVGKSTWINAFANYLLFSTLDDALKPGKLCWLIPFSFSTCTVKDERFENIDIKVGFEGIKGVSENEQDGSTGASATQSTKVHEFVSGNKMVRLIDTPGVGDTRGPAKDQENMADILRVLRRYESLHGILILLKPNDQRLSIMFRFCIQELLTHLHRKAAQNIVFGFTNTRGTNYRPGDTFGPLQALLKEYREVEIRAQPKNVYCFDSESFRYLAAFKQAGEELGDIEENRRSWEKSVSESQRLLKHLMTLDPHDVTSTSNLNEVRNQIMKLTVPLAEISSSIQGNIDANEDDLKALKQTKLSRRGLEAKLKIEVDAVFIHKVDQPRTTCSHANCIEDAPTGIEGADGKPVLKTVYRSLCHFPCSLKEVTIATIGAPDLKFCYAMSQDTGICNKCGHPWDIHLHVKYDLRPGKKQINDPDIEADLRRNASHMDLKETAIRVKKNVITQLRTEQNKMKDAAAQFSMFLRRNSIVYYNDATLKYVDHHIEAEERKVRAGGSKDKLESLRDFRNQYEEQIRVLEGYRKDGQNQKLYDHGQVQQVLNSLRQMRMHGESVRRVLDSDTEPMPSTAGTRIVCAPSSSARRASRQNAANTHLASTGRLGLAEAARNGMSRFF